MMTPPHHRIREMRRAHGLTQSALAQRIGASQKSISDWELGVSWPSKRVFLMRMCTLFGCTLDDLLTAPDDTLQEQPPHI